MKCDYCEIGKGKIPLEVVYEDDQLMAVISETAASPGQISVFPKEHYTIMELVPDSLVDHIFKVANKLSTIIFETLGAQGTNIIVQNGISAGQEIPHFCVNIIPRREGDVLNFQWKPKQLMEEEMDTAHLMLKQEGDNLVIGSDKKEAVVQGKEAEKIEEKEGEENYQLKQLKRKP